MKDSRPHERYCKPPLRQAARTLGASPESAVETAPPRIESAVRQRNGKVITSEQIIVIKNKY